MSVTSLYAIGPSLWIASVPFKMMGIDLRNCMTVIRLSDGNLLLHSPNRFDERYCADLDSLGQVKYLVAPNLMHNLFFKEWKARYPLATIIAPANISKVSPDLILNPESTATIESMLQGELSLEFVQGMPRVDETVFFHKPSRTIIFTDLAFNIGGSNNLITKFVFTLYGCYGKFGPTKLTRGLIKDELAYRRSMQRVLSWDISNIVVSHGQAITTDAKTQLSKAFNFTETF